MIYISSSCIEAQKIVDSVSDLVKEGYNNIELTGGTSYYNELQTDLLDLQDKYEINFILHNYFPPPRQPFVLNLASLDDKLYECSVSHYEKAIHLSRLLGANKYAVHAGFLVNVRVNELGARIEGGVLFDREKALSRFKEGWVRLQEAAGDDIKLYIENNVLSHVNRLASNNGNPLLFTEFEGYQELRAITEFTPLIDLAHLKVSSNSLGLDFLEQVHLLRSLTDYFHVSGNNGLADENSGIVDDEDILNALEVIDLSEAVITLEIYNGLAQVKSSYEYLIDRMESSEKGAN